MTTNLKVLLSSSHYMNLEIKMVSVYNKAISADGFEFRIRL